LVNLEVLKNMSKLFSILFLSLMMFGTAQATIINGEVHINGTANADDPTKIVFSNYYVSEATGDFADTISPMAFPSWGSPVTMQELVFSSLGALWEVGNYTYTLSAVEGAGTDHVSGVGIVSDSSNTYENSTAYFDLHMTGGALTNLSFTTSTSVPEPGTMLLMGLGMLFIAGGAAVRSRRDESLGDLAAS